jgi:aspartate--ammonia ligase
MADKKADLTGPGIGDYAELEKMLPWDYASLLSPKEAQLATYAIKDYIEENMCKKKNIFVIE